MENIAFSRVEDILAKSAIEFDRKIEQSRRNFEQEMSQYRAEAKKEYKEIRELIKQNNKQIGGMSNNMGTATTEFFYNTFKDGNKKMFGEKFDDIFKEEKRKTKKGFEDEYDILMFNGQAVCVVEVKYKADTDDVIQVLRKEKTFRENFPEHNNKKLYLAMASMSFHWRTEQACEEHGIAIIKQVGDKVIIKDKHIKAF